ncbi:hypothetical protein [Anditalea andensis]|uniref:Uncharacterized protein n=1 Tax=Anditalea andensis TaxID=1048983 RepID=A0A074KP12_9BACT|nr:hypothetical protein [Anditalea andensis]KEO71661.1 hypothetical protein EL17_23415 [Anditalea andensis]
MSLEVHLVSNIGRRITRNNTTSRAHSLNEIEVANPLFKIEVKEERFKLIEVIIDFLNVENSLRYKPTGGNTFCNIYAYDLLKLLGLYLPRVWWNDEYIELINNNQTISPVWNETVKEMNSDRIFSWLIEFGNKFNWKEVNTYDSLSVIVNVKGTIGIVVAPSDTINRKGHIALAYSKKGVFWRNTVLTEAGRINYKSSKKCWWKNFETYKFWYYDI